MLKCTLTILMSDFSFDNFSQLDREYVKEIEKIYLNIELSTSACDETEIDGKLQTSEKSNLLSFHRRKCDKDSNFMHIKYVESNLRESRRLCQFPKQTFASQH